VINRFRPAGPQSMVMLVAYTLVIKGYFLLHPAMPVAHPADGFLFNILASRLHDIFHENAAWFVLLSMVLLFTQALGINRIVNRFHLLPRNSFLPAMSYLLITTFFKQWNIFSAALLVNSLMLWALPLMISLYSRDSARDTIFNIGMITGIAALVYFPAIIFLLLIWTTLVITRPFRPAEWVIAVLGLVCPFYFLSAFLFLTGRLNVLLKIPFAGLSYPRLPQEYLALASMALILLLFAYSLYRLQQQYYKMLIQVRKAWTILLAYILVAIIASFINKAFSINMWIMSMVPFAIFTANAFWNMKRKLLADIIHAALFGFGVAIQFFTG